MILGVGQVWKKSRTQSTPAQKPDVRLRVMVSIYCTINDTAVMSSFRKPYIEKGHFKVHIGDMYLFHMTTEAE
jgi:hypothetical protein